MARARPIRSGPVSIRRSRHPVPNGAFSVPELLALVGIVCLFGQATWPVSRAWRTKCPSPSFEKGPRPTPFGSRGRTRAPPIGWKPASISRLWVTFPNPPNLLHGAFQPHRFHPVPPSTEQFFRLRSTLPAIYVVNASDAFHELRQLSDRRTERFRRVRASTSAALDGALPAAHGGGDPKRDGC